MSPKKYTNAAQTGDEGVDFVALTCTRAGVLFLPRYRQDVGFDGHFEFLNDGHEPDGTFAFFQGKSGMSFISPSGHYQLKASKENFESWAKFTVPIIGVVYNPSVRDARWVSISDYLRSNPQLVHTGPYYLEAPASQPFSEDALGRLHDAVRRESSSRYVMAVANGVLPMTGNLPSIDNRNFIGRDDLLSEMEHSFFSQTGKANRIALSGLGGMGKTQLALEYAYRHKTDYGLFLWVNAETPEILAHSFSELAPVLGLAKLQIGKEAEEIRHWLEHHGRWLLVLDNAMSARQVGAVLPRNDSGHVLITSQNAVWAELARPIPVREFSNAVAVSFLIARTAGRGADGAAELADELGCHPLALEQAAAYIEAVGCSPADYIKLLKLRRLPELDQSLPDGIVVRTVTRTVDMAMDQVRVRHAATAELMRLLAFMDADDIPCHLLQRFHQWLPESLAFVANPVAFNASLAVLRQYSLVSNDNGHLSVHRLLQRVVREQLTIDQQRFWLGAARELLIAAQDSDFDGVPALQVITSHAMVLMDHAVHLGMTSKSGPFAALLRRLGEYAEEIVAESERLLQENAYQLDLARSAHEASTAFTSYYEIFHQRVSQRQPRARVSTRDMDDLRKLAQLMREAIDANEAAGLTDKLAGLRERLKELEASIVDVESARKRGLSGWFNWWRREDQ